MSMICICGVCIPYTALWPIVLLFLRQIYTYFYPDQKDKVKSKGDTVDVELKTENGDGSASPSPVSTSEQTYVKPSLPVNYKKDMNWDDVIAADKTLIFRFTAKWCKPCKGLDPFYDQVSLENNNADVVFYNVDVDEHDEVAALNGALTIPLFVSYRSGEQIGKLTGSDTKKITNFIAESIKCSK
eukprot:gene11526-13396_t